MLDRNSKEICTIRIMFPVETDEQAIEVKRKIAEIVKDNDARTEFSIMTIPAKAPIA